MTASATAMPPKSAEMPWLVRRGALAASVGAFAVAAALFLIWPGIDLAVSDALRGADGRFLLGAFESEMSRAVKYAMTACGVALALAFVSTLLRRPLRRDRLRRLIFILAVFAIGPGLIVNGVLKQHWGRARPMQVIEFGGDAIFTPAFVISRACTHNCSFASGDASAGFAFLGPALLVTGRRRRLALAGATLLGVGLGLLRMMAGAHFLSDVVFAGLIDLLTIQLLYRLCFPPAANTAAAKPPPLA